ncbi:MAG: trypsin-like serine protease [Polyangiaceae bacterium]|nr:trypsin-like serine protease [Polyangiaceae bacterium]NUQ79082.1 trypsin-like serine protease [Polyangiaceae bacterium]
MKRHDISLLSPVLCSLLLSACALDALEEQVDDTERVGTVESAIKAGTPASISEQKTVRVNGCTGTLLSPSMVLTAAHCFPNSKDPSTINVQYGGETRNAAHLVIHPKSAYFTDDHATDVDVVLIVLQSPFTFGAFEVFPLISGGETDLLVGQQVTCYGYGAQNASGSCSTSSDCASGQWCQWGKCMTPSSILRKGVFTVQESGVDPDIYFELDVPNALGQTTLPGDSGGPCVFYNSFYSSWHLMGTAKDGNGVDYSSYTSREAFGEWASARIACDSFDPRAPSYTLCSEDCPCEVGQGDCDYSAQCRSGLNCAWNAGAKYGLPADFDVCEAPSTCPDFSAASPDPDFCTNPDCPCTYGEGDCDSDRECGGELVCRHDIGPAVGLPSTYDLCVYPTDPGCPAYDAASPSETFCSAGCPCDLGEGDCDSDSQCRPGLKCGTNNGVLFGLPPTYDLCVRP